jgi:hypothetical protein
MTRADVIRVLGQDALDCVEAAECEATSRVQTDGDTDVEYCAVVTVTHPDDGAPADLYAYYYQTEADLVAAGESDNLTWEIHGYEVW